jgi:hypothetical protein
MGPASSAGQSDVDATCTEDWILIPCATDQQSTSIMQSDGKTACVSKICGFFFDSVAAGKANIPVYSKLVPKNEAAAFANLRFLLQVTENHSKFASTPIFLMLTRLTPADFVSLTPNSLAFLLPAKPKIIVIDQ